VLDLGAVAEPFVEDLVGVRVVVGPVRGLAAAVDAGVLSSQAADAAKSQVGAVVRCNIA
jgi:hypothetical protein